MSFLLLPAQQRCMGGPGPFAPHAQAPCVRVIAPGYHPTRAAPWASVSQLRIGNIGIDRAKARECAKTAIAEPAITRSGPDDIDEAGDPFGDQIGVFDEIRGGVDDARAPAPCRLG
jgi:hypothetical protein